MLGSQPLTFLPVGEGQWVQIQCLGFSGFNRPQREVHLFSIVFYDTSQTNDLLLT
ncbi:hypothetical protein PO909_001001 [Leuciscus waleckii]